MPSVNMFVLQRTRLEVLGAPWFLWCYQVAQSYRPPRAINRWVVGGGCGVVSTLSTSNIITPPAPPPHTWDHMTPGRYGGLWMLILVRRLLTCCLHNKYRLFLRCNPAWSLNIIQWLTSAIVYWKQISASSSLALHSSVVKRAASTGINVGIFDWEKRSY